MNSSHEIKIDYQTNANPTESSGSIVEFKNIEGQIILKRPIKLQVFYLSPFANNKEKGQSVRKRRPKQLALFLIPYCLICPKNFISYLILGTVLMT